jgi:hypothetical protein
MTGLRGNPLHRGRPGTGNARPYLVPSREARELELSGGVRSLPQVPWWNADRRARPQAEGGASRFFVARPARRLRAGHETLRLSAFRFPLFVLSYFVIAGLDPAIHAAKKLRQNFGPAL